MLAHWTISAVMFIVAIIIGIIVVTSKFKVTSKLLIVTLLALSGLFTYRALNDVYGYPVVLQRDFNDVLILSHMLDKENKIMHVWIKEQGNVNPRSYSVPFNDKLAKFLERMRGKHKGRPYRVEVTTSSNPFSPFSQSLKSVEMGELIVFPPKNGKP